MANGVFDNSLFHQAANWRGAPLATLARPTCRRSTTGADLLAATEHITDLCGPPLGLGATLTAP